MQEIIGEQDQQKLIRLSGSSEINERSVIIPSSPCDEVHIEILKNLDIFSLVNHLLSR